MLLQDRIFSNLKKGGQTPAVDEGSTSSLSYTQFGQRVANLQKRIVATGLDGNIGILSNHKSETYVAVIACVLLKRPFVPLNPVFPEERLKAINEQAGIALIIHDQETTSLSLIFDQPKLPSYEADGLESEERLQRVEALAGDIAYRMFTSGSTGVPKGVPIRFDSLDHYVTQLASILNLSPGLRFSQTFDLSFDLSMHDIFLAISSGGTIVPPSRMDLMMPHAYIVKRRLDVWFSVPMLAASLIKAKAPDSGPVLTAAMFCGEPLPTSFARGAAKFVKEGGPILNLYGPTEATIAFTVRDLRDYAGNDEIMPIGKPFGANRTAVLIDGSVDEVSEGVEGELLLGGVQVFDGYEPAIAKDVFVFSSDGDQWYRSGDMVRQFGNELHHLGRVDSQVKIRGFRIELGEVEEAFRRVFDRQIVAATIVGERQNAALGIAYCGEKVDFNPEALAEMLPDYMVPRYICHLERLPVNVNGKVDRAALKDVEWV